MSDTAEAEGRREQDEYVQRIKRTIDLGLQVQQFMRTDAGRELARRANEELIAAQEALLETDLMTDDGRKAAAELQLRGRTASRVLTWLGDIVTEGENAEKAFLTSEATDLTGA